MRLAAALLSLAISAPALAQSPAFQTPGMPVWAASGQTDRFSNDFNPAIGALLDGFADYQNTDGDDEGADVFLRSFEMTLNGRVDPNWYGYAVVVYSDEEVELEEAAVTYGGFDGNTTVRFGRFFADFGKQMQAHVHDLPYPDRPGVLVAYLGEELPGVGAQLDHWWPTGDSSALRASLGLFGDMELGEEEEDAPSASIVERKNSIQEFGLTGRVTQFMDVGERGVFQWGGSVRHLGDFGVADGGSGAQVDGLSNTVFGLDLTYGLDSEDGLSGWTFGGELLQNTGDVAADLNAATSTFDVLSKDLAGYYLWAERRLDVTNTVGILWSAFDEAVAGTANTQEVTAYYTRYFSEFARMRFAVEHEDSDINGDATRFMFQLTTFFGPHAHGVNW